MAEARLRKDGLVLCCHTKTFTQSNILGFYDPCLGEAKQLVIKYRFQNRLHEVTVEDTAPVACPLRCKYFPNRMQLETGLCF